MYAASMFSPRRAAAPGAATYQATGMEIQVASADAHRLVTLLFEGFDAALADAQRAAGWREVARERRPTERNEAVVVFRRGPA